jgi:hypothetical protein
MERKKAAMLTTAKIIGVRFILRASQITNREYMVDSKYQSGQELY